MIDIIIPNFGESITEVTVASWNKQIGETISRDEILVDIETDKASQELVAEAEGILTEILVQAGETVAIGAIIGRIDAQEKASQNIQTQPRVNIPVQTQANSMSLVMPAAQRIIDDHNLDPLEIIGTGKNGRITKSDALHALNIKRAGPIDVVHSTARNAAPTQSAPTSIQAPAPKPTSMQKQPHAQEERVAMSRLHQTMARRLKESQNTAAQLTTYNEADMSAIIAMRTRYKADFERKHETRLGFMGFFIKACVQALQDVPIVNAYIEGTDIVYRNHYDISIAVGTPKGLVVPVLKNCDQLSLAQIELGLVALATKARDGALTLADMTGGTFTVSNGGVYGSLMSSPILNIPQSGILGMHKIQKRPVVIDDEIVIRPMMYLAMSYDHRLIDGAGAVTFLVRVKECLEDPQRLMLDL